MAADAEKLYQELLDQNPTRMELKSLILDIQKNSEAVAVDDANQNLMLAQSTLSWENSSDAELRAFYEQIEDLTLEWKDINSGIASDHRLYIKAADPYAFIKLRIGADFKAVMRLRVHPAIVRENKQRRESRKKERDDKRARDEEEKSAASRSRERVQRNHNINGQSSSAFAGMGATGVEASEPASHDVMELMQERQQVEERRRREKLFGVVGSDLIGSILTESYRSVRYWEPGKKMILNASWNAVHENGIIKSTASVNARNDMRIIPATVTAWLETAAAQDANISTQVRDMKADIFDMYLVDPQTVFQEITAVINKPGSLIEKVQRISQAMFILKQEKAFIKQSDRLWNKQLCHPYNFGQCEKFAKSTKCDKPHICMLCGMLGHAAWECRHESDTTRALFKFKVEQQKEKQQKNQYQRGRGYNNQNNRNNRYFTQQQQQQPQQQQQQYAQPRGRKYYGNKY